VVSLDNKWLAVVPVAIMLSVKKLAIAKSTLCRARRMIDSAELARWHKKVLKPLLILRLKGG